MLETYTGFLLNYISLIYDVKERLLRINDIQGWHK